MIENPKEEYQIVPNTQEAIIDENVWLRVQELRKNKRRPTKTNRKKPVFRAGILCGLQIKAALLCRQIAQAQSGIFPLCQLQGRQRKLHDSFYPGCSLGNGREGSGCGFGRFCALL